MKENYKSGFSGIYQCGKIHIDELSDWTENRDHLKQAADHQKPDPDGVYLAGRTDRFCGHAGNP